MPNLWFQLWPGTGKLCSSLCSLCPPDAKRPPSLLTLAGSSYSVSSLSPRPTHTSLICFFELSLLNLVLC